MNSLDFVKASGGHITRVCTKFEYAQCGRHPMFFRTEKFTHGISEEKAVRCLFDLRLLKIVRRTDDVSNLRINRVGKYRPTPLIFMT